MSHRMESEPPQPRTAAQFVSTHWSVVLAAKDTASPAASAALSRLCEVYWYPVYAFLRRKGRALHEAEDLTQAFFADVLRREWLKNVGPEKGRFRTFVMRCLTNFVTSQTRGPVSVLIDFSDAEERYGFEPVENVTPEQLFEMRWAVRLLETAMERLKRDDAADGRGDRFDGLVPYITKETAPGSYAELAARLGISEDAARQEVTRLRRRYRKAIRDEIAETVGGAEEIDAELNHLLRVLSR